MFTGDQNGFQDDPRLKAIFEAIRVVLHFPKPGIMFQDKTTMLLDHKASKYTVDIFVDRYREMGISILAGSGGKVIARSSVEAEAIALKEGVLLAERCGFKKIVLESYAEMLCLGSNGIEDAKDWKLYLMYKMYNGGHKLLKVFSLT